MAVENQVYFEPGLNKEIDFYPELWGINDDIHYEAVKALDGAFNSDLIDYYEKTRDIPLEDFQKIKVDQKEYWEALSEVDGRKWHDRGIDVLTEFFMPIEDSNFDFMLREFDYRFLDENTDFQRPAYDDHRKKSLMRCEKGDLDFVRGKVEDDYLMLEVWEVKTTPRQLNQTDQLEKVKNTREQVVENTDLNIDLEPKKLHAGEIQDYLDDMGKTYGLPKSYEGDIHISNGSKEQLKSSEGFDKFVENFLGNHIDLNKRITKKKDQEEFI